MCTSISLLDAMIHSFYRKLESSEKHKVEVLTELETEFMEDIDEFYDLDINSSLYKEEYENMRRIDGVDRDFLMLTEKLNALKTNVVTNASLELTKAQGKVNESIRRLTQISIAVAIAALVIVGFGLPESEKVWGTLIPVMIVLIGIFIVYKLPGWRKGRKPTKTVLLPKP